MGRLEGKSVVITGAGRGIGAATARLCASEGATVVAADINLDNVEAVVDEIGRADGHAFAMQTDVSNWQAADDLIEFCVSTTGKIDGLVNNAAIMHLSQPGEQDEAKLRGLLNVNVVGVFACGEAALRRMRHQGHGAIVNITSGAHLGMRFMAAYSASKGAVASVTYTWSIDNDDIPGIRINAVSPMGTSVINPDRELYQSHANMSSPTDLPDPSNNAPVIAYLLTDHALNVKGQIVRIDGPRLSFIAHPAILEPILVNSEGWSLARVEKAFDKELGGRQVPIGLATLSSAEFKAKARITKP